MAYTDLINPEFGGEMNPTYGYSVGLQEDSSIFQAPSGEIYTRRLETRGHIYELQWVKILQTTADRLKQWEAQYENDVFSYYDYERGRGFTGRFMGRLKFQQLAFNQVNVNGVFAEIPGQAMQDYPADWERDSIFIDERIGGVDTTRQNGVWTYGATAKARGGFDLTNDGLDATAYVELDYFGYGFELWSRKGPDLGQVEVSLNGVVVGAAVDLYAAAAAGAGSVFQKLDVPLYKHRVKVRALNAKNAASTGYTAVFDALRVMR